MDGGAWVTLPLGVLPKESCFLFSQEVSTVLEHLCFVFLHIVGEFNVYEAVVCQLYNFGDGVCACVCFYVVSVESFMSPDRLSHSFFLFSFSGHHILFFSFLEIDCDVLVFGFRPMSLPLGAKLSIVWCAWCQTTVCQTSGSQRLSMSVYWFLYPLSFGLLGFWWHSV